MSKKLYRSETDKMVGGIAEYFDIDSTVIRLLFVIIFVYGGSVLYSLACPVALGGVEIK